MSSTALGARFRRVWIATAAGNFGDGILLVGFPLIVVDLTRSPLLVSLVSTLATLPWLAVALFAGALADRVDRRRIILAAAWVRVAVLALLVALTLAGLVDLTVLYLAVLTLGAAEVFADTTTQSILPMIVDRERLGAANGRVIAAQRVANDFLGGPAAGVLVAVSAAAFFGVPALLYTVTGVIMLTLRGRYRNERPSSATMRTDIAEGIRYLGTHRILRALAVLAGLLNFSMSAYLAMFVLWAVGEGSVMEMAPQTYGGLFAALAAGGVAGALAVEWLSGALGEVRVLLVGAAVSSLLLLLPVLIPSAAVAFPAFVAAGFGATLTNVALVSLRQRLIRADLLGRVNATYRLIGMGTMPFGAAAGGVLGSLLGLQTVFVVAVVVALLATAFTGRKVSAEGVRRAEDEAVVVKSSETVDLTESAAERAD